MSNKVPSVLAVFTRRLMRERVSDSLVTLGHLAFEGFEDPAKASEQLQLLQQVISELQSVADNLEKQAGR